VWMGVGLGVRDFVGVELRVGTVGRGVVRGCDDIIGGG